MQNKKFTLIELLIVIAIAMLIFGITVPNLTSLPAGIQKKAAISAVNNTFKSARLLAASQSIHTMVKISDNGSTISVIPSSSPLSSDIIFLNNSLSDEQENYQSVKNIETIKTSLPNGCKIYVEDSEFYDPTAQDNQAFYFYSDGTGKGPNAALKIGSSFYSLIVTNITGKVDIVEIENTPEFIKE
ncbi:MAG: pilus assembly FimT family protein [Lentisphaeria bacterium]